MTERITVLSPPAQPPVRVADFADHLRLGSGFADDAAQTDLLNRLLQTAASVIEGRTGLALISRSMMLVTDGWTNEDRHKLPLAPVSYVASVTKIDVNFVRSGWLWHDWELTSTTTEAWLSGQRNSPLPSIVETDRVEVIFTAGFGPEPDNVPMDLRHAVTLLAATYYENRALNDYKSVPIGYDVLNLLQPYRRVRL
ncbi:putative phiE125 gp8 family phage protein [Rubricella aquisinus]|uniref:Putative phiE125 gp8 family phage protein n=1 Tax=Rubricella aquisinus TaxID=2028108 RepID=A0A840X1B0_9RHOB|nr:hypothetical protein [Rubricella aquisinus]MBB5516534.1 putative phiE125 gp8 family phage protein [Rubricella aquisinus]